MTDTPSSALDAAQRVASLSRRDFIRISAFAAGIAAAGAGPRAARAAAPVPEGLKVMGAAEHATFHRLMLALLPTAGTSLVPPESLPVMQTLDGALLAPLPPHALAGLKAGVAYFEDAPKAAFGAPFSELSDADARAFVDALSASEEVPARALIGALKFLVLVAYWAIPPTWAPLGFEGPVTEAWGLEFAGNAPMPQA